MHLFQGQFGYTDQRFPPAGRALLWYLNFFQPLWGVRFLSSRRRVVENGSPVKDKESLDPPASSYYALFVHINHALDSRVVLQVSLVLTFTHSLNCSLSLQHLVRPVQPFKLLTTPPHSTITTPLTGWQWQPWLVSTIITLFWTITVVTFLMIHEIY